MSRKEEIIGIYSKLYDDLGRSPTMAELKEGGVSKKAIRYHFGSKEKLVEVIYGDTMSTDPKNYSSVVMAEDAIEEVIQPDLKEEKRKFLVNSYIKILNANKRFPVYSDFIPYGVTSGVISTAFGGINKLKEYVLQEHEDEVKENFTTLSTILSREYNLAEHYIGKRYIVTTAVADFKIHQGFINSLKNYAAARDAEIMILPCESVTNSFEDSSATFDKEFNDPIYNFVTNDIKLNDNLFLCSVQVSAKQIKATTGLTRLGKRDGSYIFASPKQFLDYRPTGNIRGKNYSIMTTGACTIGDYFSNTVFVSKRLSYIADHDHMLGAVIVEVEDDNHFHFRQIQADDSGSFIDLGVKYNPDGTTENVKMNIILGDLHGTNVNQPAVDSFVEDFGMFDIDNIFIHDLFDGNSISHHIETIYDRYNRVRNGKHDLFDELVDTSNLLHTINALNPEGKMYVVKSNHDEFLTRYLKSGRYVNDPQNHKLSLQISLDMLDGMDVLKSAFNHTTAIPDGVVFLDRDVSLKIGGVELAAHGDKGINGARPSLNGFEEIYGDCIIGHNHSASIQRGVFRVGTMSKLDMDYNSGPSSWTITNCILYENGQRQLVNYVNGKYYM